MPRNKRIALFLAVTLSVMVVDQAVKFVVVRDLTSYLLALGDSTVDQLHAFFSEAPPVDYEGMHFHPRRFINVSDDFFRIRYAENPGAAWGLFRNLPPKVRDPIFHVVSVTAVVLLTYAFFRLKGGRDERWALWGYPLVLGGAIGNYVDRLARGFVIDFLEVHWKGNLRLVWPSFNVADMAICVGVGMLVVDAFVRGDKKSPALPTRSGPPPLPTDAAPRA